MKKYYFILFSLVFIFGSCTKKDEAFRCEDPTDCYPPAVKNIEKDCKCSCKRAGGAYGFWESFIDAGNAFCIPPGFYVAYLDDKQNWLDTFALGLPAYSNIDKGSVNFSQRNLRGSGIWAVSGNNNIEDVSYVRKEDGDSIRIDFLPFPASINAEPIARPPSLLSQDRSYFLSFEAWLPGGQDGEGIMHATIHYTYMTLEPVREPVSFDMFRVTEDQ
jgi:hypothetical protein